MMNREWIYIGALVVLAIILLYFVQPGLVESPYNEF